MFFIVGAGCGVTAPQPADQATASYDPSQRAVRIETTGCGYASERTGSGVAVGDGLVLTVAHVVVQADEIFASVGDSAPVTAVVTAVDLSRDLALLRLPPNGVPAVESATVGKGAEGLIVGGAASGTVPFEVKKVVTLTIEEVLGTDRFSRKGYAIAAVTASGDSGAGAYDDENRLIGIVFATGQDNATSWVTSSAETSDFLSDYATDVTPILCDSEKSRLGLASSSGPG